jgi:hypothetical protein
VSLLGELFGGPKVLPPALAHESKARAFVFRDKIIVTTVIDIADGPNPILLPLDVADDVLGRTIFDCIKKFRHMRRGEQLGTTLREWPAFKLSGMKTVKAFEAELMDVRIQAFNTVIQFYARPYQTLRHHLEMYGCSSQGDDVQIGETFRQVVQGAEALRTQGIV